MKKIIKDYFTFTKSERNGIIVLLLVIMLVIFFPYIQSLFVPEKQTDFTAFKNDIARFEKETQSSAISDSGKTTSTSVISKTKLFYFNPNTITTAQWIQLGVSEKISTIISHYLAKGGSFKKPEDLKKIYGFKEDDYKRLAPYVKLETENKTENNSSLIDINKSDSLELCSLKGIGPKTASKIIQFRKKSGGFFNTNQLLDIYGFRPEIFNKIKDEITVSSPSVTLISVNSSSTEELSKNPYLPYSIAKAIVDYRTRHGNFKKLTEIKNCLVVDDVLYNKVVPYLSL